MANLSYAGIIGAHTTYDTTSEVTARNLNGNLDNIRNECNGGLDNENADTTNGFRFLEVRSSNPTAGSEGRIVYNTTDDVLYIDSGTAFVTTKTQMKLGYFSRAMDAATGTAAITGVGFQPDMLEFFTELGDSANETNMSWGFDDGSTTLDVYTWINAATNNVEYQITQSIMICDGSGTNYQAGKVNSMDSDGFTISWTKGGTPAAITAHVIYRAIKY